MRNEHSEAGIAEDLIRSIVQTACGETHAKTLYEKAIGELENGLIDVEDPEVTSRQLEKISRLTEEINELAETRRKTMLYLYNMYEGDKTYWCQVKHLGVSAYTLFEAYQASDDDRELLDLALEANKSFVKACSAFLGIEITTCAACFADATREAKND